MKDQSAMPEAEAPDAAGMAAAKVRAARWGAAFSVRAHGFRQHGQRVIARILDEKPEAYLKLFASVLPKDPECRNGGVDDLSDEQIIDRIRRAGRCDPPCFQPGRGQAGPAKARAARESAALMRRRQLLPRQTLRCSRR